MKTRNRLKQGSALVMAFILIMSVGLVCGAMYGTSNQTMHSMIKTRDFLKAKMIAEAGINQAYNLIKFNFDAIDDPANFPLTDFGGGTFEVTVTAIGTNMARLSSHGICGLSDARVTVDLVNLEQLAVKWMMDDEWPNPYVFVDYPVLTGGPIGWSGGGDIRGGGRVHANNMLEMTGGGVLEGPVLKVSSSQIISMKGTAIIDGKATAPTLVGKTNNITGTQLAEPVPFVDIPQIDLTPFYQYALENNQVVSGSILINTDYAPPGGVLWVNGNAKISNGRVVGTIVATGDIEVSTGDSMLPILGFPLLISRDGSIKVTSTPILTGLIYARNGNVDWQGGGELYGSIMMAGKMNKGGGSDLIVHGLDKPPNVPILENEQTNTTDYVIISAWQN